MGVSETISRSLNVRSRDSKWARFGFSTSEDAVTWVALTYLLRSGQLLPALRRVGLTKKDASETSPTLLLWGVPIDDGGWGEQIRNRLSDLCLRLGERSSMSLHTSVVFCCIALGLVFHPQYAWSQSDSLTLDSCASTRSIELAICSDSETQAAAREFNYRWTHRAQMTAFRRGTNDQERELVLDDLARSCGLEV